MSSREWPFKLTDAKRLAQVAKDAGLTITGLRFNPVTGEIHVDTTSPEAKPDGTVDISAEMGRQLVL
jgi:hypothetical protein